MTLHICHCALQGHDMRWRLETLMQITSDYDHMFLEVFCSYHEILNRLIWRLQSSCTSLLIICCTLMSKGK